jgi:hypothetical protein
MPRTAVLTSDKADHRTSPFLVLHLSRLRVTQPSDQQSDQITGPTIQIFLGARVSRVEVKCFYDEHSYTYLWAGSVAFLRGG